MSKQKQIACLETDSASINIVKKAKQLLKQHLPELHTEVCIEHPEEEELFEDLVHEIEYASGELQEVVGVIPYIDDECTTLAQCRAQITRLTKNSAKIKSALKAYDQTIAKYTAAVLAATLKQKGAKQ